MASIPKWALKEKPLKLAEVLRLRNGMKLPKENLSELAVYKILRKPGNADWLLFSLN